MTITVLIVMHKMFVENKLIFHEMFCFDWSSYAFLSLSLVKINGLYAFKHTRSLSKCRPNDIIGTSWSTCSWCVKFQWH